MTNWMRGTAGKAGLAAACVAAAFIASVGLFEHPVAVTAGAQERKPITTRIGQAAPDKKEEPVLRRFMQRKLGATNLVLEGLVTENFSQIAKGAKELNDISHAEQWRISNDVMYRQYSAEFQRKASQLQKMAGEKNLDGSALAYFDCTMSCIECHKWVRAVLVAE